MEGQRVSLISASSRNLESSMTDGVKSPLKITRIDFSPNQMDGAEPELGGTKKSNKCDTCCTLVHDAFSLLNSCISGNEESRKTT